MTYIRWPVRGRKLRHIERRYIVEYVNAFYPERELVLYNLRLGPPPEELRKLRPELPERWFKVWEPRVDAVVVTKVALVMVEAKIRQPRAAIGQLLDYGWRAAHTPELIPYADRPVILQLVVPFVDPAIERTCMAHNIQLVEYRPDWVIAYMQERGLIPRGV